MESAKGLSLELQLVKFGDIRVLCDAVFSIFHHLAHPGIHATCQIMAARVIREDIKKDMLAWCRDCQLPVTEQHAAAIQPISVLVQQFLHLHVDLVGPLSMAHDGSRYLLLHHD